MSERTASGQRGAAVALLLTAVLGLAACAQEKGAPQEQQAHPPQTEASTAPAAEVPAALPDDAPAPQVSGARAMQYVREIVAFGPRPVGSVAHAHLEAYLRAQLKDDGLEEDSFTARVHGSDASFRNFIAKFPGTKDGIIMVAGHYDTKPIKGFVGANDGGSSSGLLLELAQQLRGKQREGYSVWLVWLDGEEAMQASGEMNWDNSLFGSRHLAQKWQKDGTLKKVKAFLLLDMIGDADLNVDRDLASTPWLLDLVYQAATRLGYQSHFFQRRFEIFDDHVPFSRLGVPVADLIDFDYGYGNVFWHTSQDTLDKLSPKSLEIVGEVVLESIRLLAKR
jgi:glutaminyl-peptide cyclotransferase